MGTDSFRFLIDRTLQFEVYHDIAFGCALENRNFQFAGPGQGNIIGGIMGLTTHTQSFLTQLDGQIQGRFSYCLTSLNEANPGISSIHFGADAYVSGYNNKRISMNSHLLYHLYFRGISVNGNRLRIERSFCRQDT